MIAIHVSGWTSYMPRLNRLVGVFFLCYFFFQAGLWINTGQPFKDHANKVAIKFLRPFVLFCAAYFIYYYYFGYAEQPFLSYLKRSLFSLVYASPSWKKDIWPFGFDNISVGPIWFWSAYFWYQIILR